MFARYKKNAQGKLVKTADIFQKHEHGIQRSLVDPDALKIIARLRSFGYTAYIVGGAVRDLLLNKRPKDFDISTSAEPNQIKKLFRNSRIIGKRFRLVHVFFSSDKIIEVSTFRSSSDAGFQNIYGTIEEDVRRRDFTLNALYYDPHDEQVVDYVGGLKDIRRKRLQPIMDRKTIFADDPVRMIRAIKYSVSTGCKIPWLLSRTMRASHNLLSEVSHSRLSEEVFKILAGGNSEGIIRQLCAYKMLQWILPGVDALFKDFRYPSLAGRTFLSLRSLDEAVRDHHESRRSMHLARLIAEYFFQVSPFGHAKKVNFAEIFYAVKELLKPVIFPNADVEKAIVYLIRQRSRYQTDGALPALTPDFPESSEAESQYGSFPEHRRRGPLGPRQAQAPSLRGQHNAGQGHHQAHANHTHLNHSAHPGQAPHVAQSGDVTPARKKPRRRRKPKSAVPVVQGDPSPKHNQAGRETAVEDQSKS